MKEEESDGDEAAHEGDLEFEVEHFAFLGIGAGGARAPKRGDGMVIEKDEGDKRHDKLENVVGHHAIDPMVKLVEAQRSSFEREADGKRRGRRGRRREGWEGGR